MLEVAPGLELAKTGLADYRLDVVLVVEAGSPSSPTEGSKILVFPR
jgi:hypothetical protein